MGAPRSAVASLVLSSPHGVDTIAPSVRAVAAWLAPKRTWLREALLEREPLVLLAHGDPSQLSLVDRKRLLLEYAQRDARGDVVDHFVDQRSLWMFADPALSDAIQEAWRLNTRGAFRFDIVRMIEEGAIKACANLVLAFALEKENREWQRAYAANVLSNLGDVGRLRTMAADLFALKQPWSANLAPGMAAALFPTAISIDQVLALMAGTAPARAFQNEGFGPVLVDIFKKCPDAHARERLLQGVADLCFEAPHSDWPHLSKRHRELAKALAPTARAAIVQSDDDGVSAGLLRVLLAAERADLDDERDASAPSLDMLVAERPVLKRALLWADAELEAREKGPEKAPRALWDFHRPVLWTPNRDDLPWLEEDLRARERANERAIVLSLLIALARDGSDASADIARLDGLIEGDPYLVEELAKYRRPPTHSEAETRWQQSSAKRKAKERETQAANERDLVSLRDRLQQNPGQLRDAAKLSVWPGPMDLATLTRWLARAQATLKQKAPAQWRALLPAFGADVAHAYRDGMVAMWRITEPVRPRKNTFTWPMMLSLGGLELEASDDPRWAEGLSTAQAARAAGHACLYDQGCPDWLSALVSAQPEAASPFVIDVLRKEWRREAPTHAPFLYECGHGMRLSSSIEEALFTLLRRAAPASISRLEQAHALLTKLSLSEAEQKALLANFKRRFTSRLDAEAWDWALGYVALVFELDFGAGQQLLERYFQALPAKERQERVERAFGLLFGPTRGIVRSMRSADARAAARLLRLAYKHVRIEDDQPSGRSDEVNRRDEAQMARNQLLNLLMGIRGEQSYREVVAFADEQTSTHRKLWIRQLARGMAEKDADREAWALGQALAFERKTVGPVRNGDDLLDLVCAQLDDIVFDFQAGDASSRAVLQTAIDENAVQEWLYEQLSLRADSRVHVQREQQVALEKMPDIVVSSTTIKASVAIEVKHGSKGWSLEELRRALKHQLAELYLKPKDRRHGIFVLTNHVVSYRIDTDERRRVSFGEVISKLGNDAQEITRVGDRDVVVRVRGIDAVPQAKASSAAKRAKKKATA